MWTLALLTLCLASPGLCLDSNEIRSSREIITDPEPTVMLPENFTVNVSALNNVRRRQKSPECTNQQRNGCQQTSKKRRVGKKKPSLDDMLSGREARRNQCVRSRDCEEGFCCVQYGGKKRCQRFLQEGEMCILVQPKNKSRRRVSRCSCMDGLNCLPMSGALKGAGVCHVMEKERDTQQ